MLEGLFGYRRRTREPGRATHLARSVFNTPAMIRPETLRTLTAVVGSLQQGYTLDPADVERVIAAKVEAAGSARPEAASLSAGAVVRGGDSPVVDGVAVIPVEGLLLKRGGVDMRTSEEFGSYEGVGDELALAMADPDVRAVLLRVWSPGGTCEGCYELADAVHDAAGSGVKPVGAFIDGEGCSGAYAVACSVGVGRLYASRGANVGSVGVYAAYVEAVDRLKKEGITPHVLSAGTGKVSGHSMTEFGDEDIDRLQNGIDNLYALFVGVVARGRDVTPESVVEMGAAVFIGDAAREQGLVDEITTLEGAVALMAEAGADAPAARPGAAALNAHTETGGRAMALTRKKKPAAARAEDPADDDAVAVEDEETAEEIEDEESADETEDDAGDDESAATDDDDDTTTAEGDDEEPTARKPKGTRPMSAQQAREKEKKRCSDIRAAAKGLGLAGSDLESELIDGDVPAAEACQRLIAAHAEKSGERSLASARSAATDSLVEGDAGGIAGALGGDGTGRLAEATSFEGAVAQVIDENRRSGLAVTRGQAMSQVRRDRPDLWKAANQAALPKKGSTAHGVFTDPNNFRKVELTG